MQAVSPDAVGGGVEQLGDFRGRRLRVQELREQASIVAPGCFEK